MTTNGHPEPNEYDGPADPMPAADALPEAAPLAVPIEVPVARPVLTDHDRFLLLGTRRPIAWMDAGILILCLFVLEMAVGVAALISVAMSDSPIDLADGLSGSELQDALGQASQTILAPMLLLRAAVAVGVIWMMTSSRKQGRASVGLPRKRWGKDVLIGVVSTPVVYGVIHVAIFIVLIAFPGLGGQVNENIKRIQELIPKMPLAGFFGLSVVIGVYEELIFRGFLMTRFRRGTGSWTAAVLLSSALFTGLHAFDQEPIALIVVGILSITFSLLTIWRRSIIPAIVTHALFDFSQFVGIFYLMGDAAS